MNQNPQPFNNLRLYQRKQKLKAYTFFETVISLSSIIKNCLRTVFVHI